jgi:CheY-like chemotaxis protein
MADLDRIRVLIVENEGLVGCDLATTLERLGYKVAGLCRTGEEVLDTVEELRPDVVLMDIQLAGTLDGIETAQPRAIMRSSVASGTRKVFSMPSKVWPMVSSARM